MKLVLKVVAVLFLGAVVIGAGFYLWASFTTDRIRSRTFDSHAATFPIPFPLSEEEIQKQGLTEVEAARLALERARERGRHLVAARYGCGECHGKDFSGGVMVDAFPLGRLLGPNLTSGVGGRTARYTPANWDRIVRHGLLPDGRPAAMPSVDFQHLTDQELSDIITYIQSQAPVDNEVPRVSFGPLGKVLIATRRLPLSADLIESHDAPHAVYPPSAEVSVEFGRHLGGVCTGCHGQDLTGGPIVGGDPSWPAARNITPHADGLAGWGYEQFAVAMQEGRRPDGSQLRAPMTFMLPYAKRMTDTELRALWAYLQSVPPRPSSR